MTILGCRVDRVDMDAAVAIVTSFMSAPRFAHVVTLGAEMANLAYCDLRYRAVINAADLVVADTVGVVVASRWLRKPVPARVPGIDLLEQLCRTCARVGWPIFLLGGAPGVAEKAAADLQARHIGLPVAGTQHGYFPASDDAEIAAAIGASGARLVLVGMGFPRQEFWIADHRAALGPATCIGVGGAFDVLSGRIKRAPLAVRRAGFEWLYRLIREPRRVGRQLALPVFAVRALRQALSKRSDVVPGL